MAFTSIDMVDSATLEQAEKMLKKISKLGQGDPAFALDWNVAALAEFVRGANNNAHIETEPQAHFITTAPGIMTVTSLQNDIVGYLATASGGRVGVLMLAPNTLSQYANILIKVSHVELNPWMQSIMARSFDRGSYLATLYLLVDQSVARAVPIGLVDPPPGMRRVFQ